MENIQKQIERLRADVTESYLIGGCSNDAKERELFTRLAEYLTVLAETAECVMTEREARRE